MWASHMKHCSEDMTPSKRSLYQDNTCYAPDLYCHAQNLATECEIEEEYLVNNLQKRIGKLHLEKGQLEQSLGHLQRKVHCA